MTAREQYEDGDRTITQEGRDGGPGERAAGEQNRRWALEDRWQRTWERLGVFRARDDGERERRYLLTMFPYPSGDLHMGHAEVFALEDVLARYWRARGYDVLNPVGWDSFGLPAENAAIRSGASPAEYTYANIETQAASMRRYGVSFDWSRRLHTSDPEYYRWTQWLFLRMRERGLVHRATAPVNWCPADQTVLANEQVVAGRCERCGAEVVRRELTQWFVRITAYAQRLLDDMDRLDGWPEQILAMQRHWIGRSEGALIGFDVASGRDDAGVADRGTATVPVFTTRPETLPGVTFVALAPDGDLADAVCAPQQRAALVAYRAALGSDRERAAADRAPSGVFLGVHAAHPATGAPVPVYAADYVLPHHGTGAVMGVPAHDERDRAFAIAHALPQDPPGPGPHGAEPGPDGAELDLDGLTPATAAERVVEWAERTGRGRRHVAYRLRDWLVSRQRYWGTPIPIVHCPACGEVAVPDGELPVRLPGLRGADLEPRGTAPLENATDWVAVPCPGCGGPALRDTDTMDTFVDSSWYFFRYCSPHAVDAPFDVDAARRWLPVDTYVGGAEHAILHLLYVRFVTKVVHDLGLTDVVEPFTHLVNQGQVINRGRTMSKSLGNGVDLGAQLDRYGVDAVRLAMVFAGPPSDDVDWADVRPEAMQRFLGRALRLADDVGSAGPGEIGSAGPDDAGSASPRDDAADGGLRAATHRTVRAAEELIDAGRFNVVIARLMELTSATRAAIDSGPGAGDPAVREAVEALAVVLSLFAPYAAEEMWERLGHGPSVALAPWPEADESLLTEDTVEAAVQVGGKVRDRVVVPVGVGEAELVERALALPGVRRALAGREVARTIVRAPHLVSLVPE